MKNLGLVALIEISFFAAFAFILDLLPSFRLSASISISFAMVPIFILAFRWGMKAALFSGFLWGLLQVVMGDLQAFTPVQVIIEYFVAFAFVGFAGLFYKPVQHHFQNGNKKTALFFVVVAVFVGSLARYFWHFIAGFVFWAEYAPEGMNAVLFSFIVNGITMLGAAILCSVLLVLLLVTAPKLIQRKGAAALSNSKTAS